MIHHSYIATFLMNRYVPHTLWPFDKYYPYISGGGILLSQLTATAMSAALLETPYLPSEDVYVGILAHDVNVSITDIPGIVSWSRMVFTPEEGASTKTSLILRHYISDASDLQFLYKLHADTAVLHIMEVDDEVKEWLRNIDPSFPNIYAVVLNTEGYDTLNALKLLKVSDMRKIGIRAGHRSKFKAAINAIP